MKTWTIITLIAITALGVGCIVDVQESTMAFGDDKLGVTGFPRMVGALLALASLALLVQTIVKKDEGVSLKGKVDYRSVVALILSVGYILGVCYLGFRVSTLVYLLVLPPLFDRFRFATRRSPLWLVLYAFGVTLVFHVFFKVFKVYLPDTIWF